MLSSQFLRLKDVCRYIKLLSATSNIRKSETSHKSGVHYHITELYGESDSVRNNSCKWKSPVGTYRLFIHFSIPVLEINRHENVVVDAINFSCCSAPSNLARPSLSACTQLSAVLTFVMRPRRRVSKV